jgi:CRISPR-associated protein Csx17
VAREVILKGCSTEPMAGYLKALAVFRLVSEQADPWARGWWDGNSFCLESKLDADALLQFFLDEYVPTPIVAPWNGGSGFVDGDRRVGIDAILASGLPRLAEYRRTIGQVFTWPEFSGGESTLGQMIDAVHAMAPGKPRDDVFKLLEAVERVVQGLACPMASLRPLTTAELKISAPTLVAPVRKMRTAVNKSKRSAGKGELVRACRNRLGDGSVAWIDCAVVLRSATELKYPPLLGTGGGEGRLDYTNSFMERVSSLLLKPGPEARSLLQNALFAIPTDELTDAAVGQHDPGRAGGFNQGPEVETKDFPTNPWNFVMTLEGAVAWASGAARRQGTTAHGVSCSPFTVRARAIGYGSAEANDEEAGRAEVWMPTWERPARYEEFRILLREGRAEWGGKPVNNGIEFVEAAASLGTDRGIAAFVRYSLLKRRGDSYVALPVGRVPVQEQKDSDLLQELDRVLQTVDGFARGFKSGAPPAQFASRRRQIDSAIYEFALRGGAERFQQILAALGRLEQFFAQRNLSIEPKLRAPLAGLSPRWLLAANDGSLNYRIAVAVASIGRTGDVGGIRANLAPVEPRKPWTWATGKGQVAFQGSSLAERFVSVLRRRLMDAERLNCESLPLWSAVTAAPEDAAAFLRWENVDESLIEQLLFGLTLVQWYDPTLEPVRAELYHSWRPAGTIIPRNYALLKHLFHPQVQTRPEPSILSLLLAGRTKAACEVAHHRIRNTGLSPRNADFPDEPDAVRLAASLLVPIHPIESLSRLVLREDGEAATRTTGR